MIQNRAKNRLFSSLIALAIFASGLVAAFHHHAEEAKAADYCAVCVVAQQARVGTVSSTADQEWGCDFQEFTLIVPEFYLAGPSALWFGKRSQAPPLI